MSEGRNDNKQPAAAAVGLHIGKPTTSLTSLLRSRSCPIMDTMPFCKQVFLQRR